jgi:hypothetical protein
MTRRLRAFQPAAVPLEGRILLAHMHKSPLSTIMPPPTITPPPPDYGNVMFLGASSPGGIMQQVVQQGSAATVWLGGSTDGPVQVKVATDPSSPAVGVNLPAVNQTVTIAGTQRAVVLNLASGQYPLTIPTIAGAPNPGEVDVDLTITPINPPPGLTVSKPLELRILAPDAKTPPRIIGVAGTPDGIKLMFSKPMNPVQASNMHNYAVWVTYNKPSNGFLGFVDTLYNIPGWLIFPEGGVSPPPGPLTARKVPLRLAEYDPATNTVTLVPKRRLNYGSIVVTPGSPAKTSAPPRRGSSPAQGLTDLVGNPINQHGKPGKFRISVFTGYTPLA